MDAHNEGDRSSHPSNCWRVPTMPSVVLFNGRYRREFIPHAHDVATIVLVTKGAYLFSTRGRTYAVKAGDMVVIGPEQIHAAQILHPDGWEMRTLHVPADLLIPSFGGRSTCSASLAFAAPVRSSDQVANGLFLEMHRYATTSGDAERQQVALYEFFEWFKHHMALFGPDLRMEKPADSQTRRVEELIYSSVVDNTPIDEIAEETGISTYALIRRFKSRHGIPPHAWRMQIRAGEVARLMQSGLQLAEIAARCGFCDQAHMTRIFRSVYGVTPGQYRDYQ
ncbi:AraC-like DNA-binding protein [Paraburkholderia sp. MM5384-R2]|nr:AraC-like DNA-binding protein [Paraburkholderia sp. MM5384-R2]